MSWTLRDANGVEKSAADWGVDQLERARVNQLADTLTFRAAGRGSDADPLFEFGSTVLLFQNGAPWFYGRVIQVPGRATASTGEEQLYRLAGPWWWLENLVFQQAWEVTNGTTPTLVATNQSRIILSQAADGTKLGTGAAILEVLNYAIAQGAPLAVGTITPAAIAPYAETLDESCASIIRHLLRWTPDAVAAFDYTTTPYPTLSIVQRSSAPTVSLPAYGAPVSALELTPRHDLQVPSVQLKFEQTNDLGGDTFTSLTVQTAPAGATGLELGAMVMTISLAGARATYHSQSITTAPIPATGATTSAVPWWQGKFPWLADFTAGDLTVVDGTQSVTLDADAGGGVSASDLPNELLSGSVSSWMNFQSAPLRVQATLKYTGTQTNESSDVFGPTKERVVYTRVVGTNADTGTYRRLTSATFAEPVPAGLAAALYAAAGVLQYDGALELTETECSGAAAPGQLLNLTGGRAEWTTMAAQVQRVEERLDTGVTKITVGPAKHLDQGDLQALLRVNRNRQPSYRLVQRTTGEASGDAAQVLGGEQGPRSDSVVRPSSGGAPAINQPFQLLDASDETGLKVKVNVNSFLLQSLTPNDLVTITGLGTTLSAAAGLLVWLEIDFESDGATFSTATINSGSAGWSGFPTPFAYTGDSPDQVLASAFLLIGYIVSSDSTLDGATITGGPSGAPVSAKVIQCVTQNLLLRAGVFNGQAMIFPFPHHGPEATP